MNSRQKIGIIIEPYEEHNASGIAHCILNQTEGLLASDSQSEYLLYTSKPLDPRRIKANARNVLIPSSLLGKNLWFLRASILGKDAPDVLIFNMPLLPLVLPRRIKTVPVCYEHSFEAENISIGNRLFIKLQNFFELFALRRAARIVVPSEGTRKELIRLYDFPQEKISRIYLGFQDLRGYAGRSSRFEGYKDHFLFVGKVKNRKNVHNIVEGFILFKKKHPESPHALVLAGDYGGPYYEKLKRRIEEEGMGSSTHFLGYCVREDLYSLYMGATALTFCSLQEGFGMPIVEAMELGVPVITSNRPPMDEVGGEAALIVDPENPNDICHAMEVAAFDEVKRDECIRRGIERAKEFSWEKHVRELAAVIAAV